MDAKKKLMNILEENKKLKEELNMSRKKLKEQNLEGTDTQVAPAQPLTKSDGTALDSKNASADDLGKKYEENEADVDTQATPTDAVPASDGTKLDAVAASQDDLNRKYASKKMEQSPEGEEDNEEEAAPVVDKKLEEQDEEKPIEEQIPETDLAEKYSEMEGDMGKVVEIMEALKNEIDGLKQEIATIKGGESEEGDVEGEKPEPPMVEKANLSSVFVEAMKVKGKDDFGKAVQNVIY